MWQPLGAGLPQGVPKSMTSATTGRRSPSLPRGHFRAPIPANKRKSMSGTRVKCRLISGGEDPIGSHSPYVTPSGQDIFFSTTQGLLPQDNDHVTDAYDARVDGGFPPPPAPPPVCEGGEACHGPPAPDPPPRPWVPNRSSSPQCRVKSCRALSAGKRFVHKRGKCVKKAKSAAQETPQAGRRHQRGGGK